MSTASDQLRFADDAPPPEATPSWKVLVVDDDPEVHAVTRLALDRCRYDGRPIAVLSAASAAEGRTLLAQHDDIALILLDVVMETPHAGLDFVRHVREALGNRLIRIVLRTGQPGEAPPREVVTRYEIDDYRTKTELTFERLQIIVITALRGYTMVASLAEREAELIRRNEQLERFTDLASQDLQEPLRNIVSSTQLLTRRLDSTLAPDDARILTELADAAHLAYRTIDSLVEYARLGRNLGAPRVLQLDDVLRGALSRLRPFLQGRGAQIAIDPLPQVRGHADLLELAFAHLIENAVRYRGAAAPQIRVTATTDERSTEIRVADNGIGIDPRLIDKIFEPFSRLHTPSRYPGAGLGLAIARRAVELDGGTLTATSDPGVGTTMILRLPRHRPGG
ncbi:ATP-binding protein [Fontimonas sp. SYSU GA230001]|uniref:sensor histidine kinase n=1 Tax=Fontimonas sp. SYSU GA230001 TaxID=3142450 RepID=UPI0032B385F0